MMSYPYHWFDGGCCCYYCCCYYCCYFDEPCVSRTFQHVSAYALSSMSLECMIFHKSCKCEFSSASTPYAWGCDQGEKPRPESICSRSCTCKACQFGDIGNEIEGWIAGKRPCYSLDVDICKVCLPYAF